MLLAVILGGMNATDAFGVKVGLTKVKGYLIFILIFTAVSNLLVSEVIFRWYIDADLI